MASSEPEEAIDVLDRSQANVIVSDLAMPEDDGYSLIQVMTAGALAFTKQNNIAAARNKWLREHIQDWCLLDHVGSGIFTCCSWLSRE